MMQIYCVGVGLALVAERPVLVIVNYPVYKGLWRLFFVFGCIGGDFEAFACSRHNGFGGNLV
jgi:hypothetical protein